MDYLITFIDPFASLAMCRAPGKDRAAGGLEENPHPVALPRGEGRKKETLTPALSRGRGGKEGNPHPGPLPRGEGEEEEPRFGPLLRGVGPLPVPSPPSLGRWLG